MRSIKLKNVIYIFIIIWSILWVNFIFRDMYIKGGIDEYKILLTRSAEGKQAHVYGEDFYEYLKFVENNIPKDAIYKLVGTHPYSHDSRRATYYLYPRISNFKEQDFILVYGKEGYSRGGFGLYKKMDEKKFIIKRMQTTGLGR